jgi:hypothetical protein
MVLCSMALAAATASAQTQFSSGSTGADGPLTFTASGEYVIDMSTKPDGVWNYTTINIPAGVKVSFTKNAANTGVIWLATGDVNIAGEIDLDGANGTLNVVRGNEAPGGPGGFRGGRGARRVDVSGTGSGTPGEGPGGGAPGTTIDCSGSGGGEGGVYSTSGPGGLACSPIGGSGGGGSGSVSGVDGKNAGGGGGAILIASSTTIAIDGGLHANGGTGSCTSCGGDYNTTACGGGGSGGAIRLVANRIEGSGSITALGGEGSFEVFAGFLFRSYGGGGPGRIRTQAFVLHLTNLTNPVATEDGPLPFSLCNGSIRITNIAGQVVPVLPGGDTSAPDVIFTQAGPITVALATTNIPHGTVLTVRVATDGQAITAQSLPTDAAGDASATLTVPAGFGTIQAYVEYTVTP